MKILMTADPVGGVFTYAVELIGALAPHGVQVHLATQGRRLASDQRAAVDRLANCEVYESEFKLEWMEDPWEDLARATAWVRSLVDELQPDLLHFNDYAIAGAEWSAPKIVVGHSCVASWFEAVKGEPLPPSWSRYREAVARGLHRAEAVVAPSAAMLQALQRHYGLAGRSEVIENARSASDFEPSGAKEPFIVAAGRLWDQAKNLAALNDVAPRLSWPVLFAGEDANHSNGRCWCNARHWQGVVERPEPGPSAHQLGRLPSEVLARVLGAAGLYVFPAKYEPFGLSILEAALSGCALVLGDIPSLRELWSGCAVFVDPDDRDALVDAVELLIGDPEWRMTLAAAALERGQMYNPERQARRYLALYEQLIRRGADACAS